MKSAVKGMIGRTLADCIGLHKAACARARQAAKVSDDAVDIASEAEASALRVVIAFPCSSLDDVVAKARYLRRAMGRHDQLEPADLKALLNSIAVIAA